MNQAKTLKQLPKTEQPYEKALCNGTKTLSDAELLSILLRCGTKDCNVLQLSMQLLKANKIQEGLCGLAQLEQEDLMQISGIGHVKAIQIQCIMELAVRLSKQKNLNKISMTSPDTVAACYLQEMRYLKKEKVKLLFFDTKNHLLGEDDISFGTVNASLISPREIFLAALSYHAVHLILLHNHPSGDPTPSKEDIMVSKRVSEAGLLIGITLMDHIIIGDNKYVSLKEKGLL